MVQQLYVSDSIPGYTAVICLAALNYLSKMYGTVITESITLTAAA